MVQVHNTKLWGSLIQMEANDVYYMIVWSQGLANKKPNGAILFSSAHVSCLLLTIRSSLWSILSTVDAEFFFFWDAEANINFVCVNQFNI